MKVPRPSIFLQFTVLGVVVFVVLGVFLSTLIEPVINEFILEQRELNSVVFANRLAAEILKPEDFTKPVRTERDVARFEQYTKLLQVPGIFRIKVWNSEGVIIYSDEKKLIGQKFSLPEGAEKAFNLEATAKIEEFDADDLHHEYEKSFIKGLEVYVPITFGNSTEVVGVVETYSRTGFIEKQISELKVFFTERVALSLLIMFLVLSLIVWRASRTVDRQKKELSDYAIGLEKMVETRTKQLKRATEREIDKANELLKVKDQFVFIAAHELRTPASAIKWVLGSMELKYPKMFKEEEKSFSVLRKSNNRLLGLVQDILNIARIESKTVDITLEKVSAPETVSDAMDETKGLAEKFNVVVENKIQENTPNILSDPIRLREVFVNLISNAIKYSKKGDVVTIASEVKNDRVVFHIIDEGIGMSAEQQKHVFEKFWRAEAVKYTEGTGLGLFIVKQLVELMSGEIWFKSEPEKGTTFSFSFKKSDSVAKNKVTKKSSIDKKKKI